MSNPYLEIRKPLVNEGVEFLSSHFEARSTLSDLRSLMSSGSILKSGFPLSSSLSSLESRKKSLGTSRFNLLLAKESLVRLVT